MKIKIDALLSTGIFISQSTQAKRFIETLIFFTDWQTAATSPEKHALSLPIALNTQLDQTSYRIYNQAYLSPETTQLNAIQNKSRNRLSLF